MNPQVKLFTGLIIATLILFGGLLYWGSREGSSTAPSPAGAAYSAAFDDKAQVMYFYSDDCHFCQQQKPILDDLAAEGYRVKPMDVKANYSYWQQYNIRGTPTFVAGNDRLVGLQEKEALRSFLDVHGGKTVP